MPDAVHLGSGKVRELYALDDERLLLVASDRISTFDVVLPTAIPDKGRVLTGLAAFWFARTRSICANHLLALRPDGRSTECRRLEMLPIECVVRGYLAGSGWKDYRQDRRGLRPPAAGRAARVGPAARADLHPGHQGPVRPRREHHARAGRRDRRGRDASPWPSGSRSRSTGSPRAYALERGIIIADTKFEFGADRDGPARPGRRGPHARLLALLAGRPVRAGRAAAVLRQAVRARLLREDRLGKTYPGPELPDDVVAGTRRRYVEAFEHLTAIRFDDYLADPSVVLA